MFCWRRKYHELSAGQKRLLFGLTGILLAGIGVLIVSALVPGRFVLQKTAILRKNPDVVFFHLNTVDQLNKFMPWVDQADSIANLNKNGKYYKFRRFALKNGTIVRIRKTVENPVYNVGYELCVNNDYDVDMDWAFALVDSSHTKVQLSVTTIIPFQNRWRYFQIRREVTERVDSVMARFQHLMAKLKKNYRLRLRKDTIPAPQKYLAIHGVAHRMDYAKQLDEDLPDVLMFAIHNNLMKRGTKPIIVLMNRKKDSLEYVVGVQIKDTVFDIPGRYVQFYIPQAHYKQFEIIGDYVYSSLAYREAIKRLKASNEQFLYGKPYFIEMVVGHTRYPKDPSKWKMYLYLPIAAQNTENE